MRLPFSQPDTFDADQWARRATSRRDICFASRWDFNSKPISRVRTVLFSVMPAR